MIKQPLIIIRIRSTALMNHSAASLRPDRIIEVHQDINALNTNKCTKPLQGDSFFFLCAFLLSVFFLSLLK